MLRHCGARAGVHDELMMGMCAKPALSLSPTSGTFQNIFVAALCQAPWDLTIGVSISGLSKCAERHSRILEQQTGSGLNPICCGALVWADAEMV